MKKKLGLFLLPALLAMVIPWQYAGAAATVLPPDAAPDAQQVLTLCRECRGRNIPGRGLNDL